LINLAEHRLPQKVFNWDYEGRRIWSSTIEQIFETLGLTQVYDDKLKCDLLECKSLLQNNMYDDWKEELSSKPKLRTYRKFKTTFKTEAYLNNFMIKCKRSILAQFRCGILPLRIETGRFINILDEHTGMLRRLLPEERLCQICNMGKIEDEFHFLCKCPKYEDIRKELFNVISKKSSNFHELDFEEKFIFLIKNSWKETADFLYRAWKIRTDILFK
jgi:hypothetical protein